MKNKIKMIEFSAKELDEADKSASKWLDEIKPSLENNKSEDGIKVESRFLFLLDPGHGGLDPNTGKYVTAGKRSPVFSDGSVLYEGVNNRDNVKRVGEALSQLGIESINIVNDWRDISLAERVSRANKIAQTRKCVYLSFHSDAFGNGKEFTSPQGITLYTSPGQTKSDLFADLWYDSLEDQFKDTVQFRTDSRDGDKDKEANFYVIRKTSMPAVLIEGGFHTNEKEAKRMQTDEWKEKLVRATVEAIEKFEIVG